MSSVHVSSYVRVAPQGIGHRLWVCPGRYGGAHMRYRRALCSRAPAVRRARPASFLGPALIAHVLPPARAEPEPPWIGPHVGPPSRASPAGPGSTRRGGVADANVNECRLICTVLVARACFGVSSLLPKNDMHEQTGKPWRPSRARPRCVFLYRGVYSCKLGRVMHSEFYLVVL